MNLHWMCGRAGGRLSDCAIISSDFFLDAFNFNSPAIRIVNAKEKEEKEKLNKIYGFRLAHTRKPTRKFIENS